MGLSEPAILRSTTDRIGLLAPVCSGRRRGPGPSGQPSIKSFKREDGAGDERPPSAGRNVEVDLKGEKRSNETHASTTDPDARLYRKGPGMGARLSFLGHASMENRSGLVVDACLTPADGHGERVAALAMIEKRADRPTGVSLGADKGYDAADFVNEVRAMNVRPHVAQNTSRRRSAIDGRATRHASYELSQRIRKRIEEAFGLMKTIAGQRRTKLRGIDRVGWSIAFAAAAYNLARLPKLLQEKAARAHRPSRRTHSARPTARTRPLTRSRKSARSANCRSKPSLFLQMG